MRASMSGVALAERVGSSSALGSSTTLVRVPDSSAKATASRHPVESAPSPLAMGSITLLLHIRLAPNGLGGVCRDLFVGRWRMERSEAEQGLEGRHRGAAA